MLCWQPLIKKMCTKTWPKTKIIMRAMLAHNKILGQVLAVERESKLLSGQDLLPMNQTGT
jgi:hypothetical protein